jgi:hypothetical protein
VASTFLDKWFQSDLVTPCDVEAPHDVGLDDVKDLSGGYCDTSKS